MQLFPCPFCGERDEREFLFAGEPGKTRPPTARPRPAKGEDAGPPDVSAPDWAAYLHAARNARGPSAEVWMHLPCGELFVMERDTVTMEVLSTRPLREDPA